MKHSPSPGPQLESFRTSKDQLPQNWASMKPKARKRWAKRLRSQASPSVPPGNSQAASPTPPRVILPGATSKSAAVPPNSRPVMRGTIPGEETPSVADHAETNSQGWPHQNEKDDLSDQSPKERQRQEPRSSGQSRHG